MWEEARKGEELGQTRPVHMMGSWGREEERFTSQKRHACQRGTLGTWRTGEGAWHSLPHPLDPRGSAETPGLVLHALRPEALQRPRQEGLSLVLALQLTQGLSSGTGPDPRPCPHLNPTFT